MRRIFSLVVSFVFIITTICSLSVFAQGQINIEQPVISGDVVNLKIHIDTVGRREIALNAYLNGHPEKSVHSAQFPIDTDKNPSYSFKLPEDATTGKYIISAYVREAGSSEVSFPYLSVTDQKRFLDIIKEKNEIKIEEWLTQNSEIVQIGKTSQDRSNAALIIKEHSEKFVYSDNNIPETYQKAVDTGRLSISLLEKLRGLSYSRLTDFFAENKEILFGNLPEYNTYLALSTADKNKLSMNTLVSITKAAADYKSFRKDFAEAVNNYEPIGNVPMGPSGGTPGGGGSGDKGYNIQISNEVEPYRFIDLKNVNWASDSIYYLSDLGIISQPKDKLFRPNDSITREEFVKMLVLAFEIQLPTKLQETFTDVHSEDWFSVYVQAAMENGFLKGYEDGSFGVGKNITREELATMTYRVAQGKKIFTSDSKEDFFADNEQIAEYAKEAVYVMKASAIINGSGDNQFLPKNRATRAEAAKIIAGIVRQLK